MDYKQQALDFLETTGATLTIRFERYGKYFTNDDNERLIYSFTIERGGRKYTATFGESIAFTYEALDIKPLPRGYGISISDEHRLHSARFNQEKQTVTIDGGTKPIPLPDAYSILASLEKHEPSESVDDWARDYGYTLNDRTTIQNIIDIHQACINQYKGLCMLFNESEMDVLRDIS